MADIPVVLPAGWIYQYPMKGYDSFDYSKVKAVLSSQVLKLEYKKVKLYLSFLFVFLGDFVLGLRRRRWRVLICCSLLSFAGLQPIRKGNTLAHLFVRFNRFPTETKLSHNKLENSTQWKYMFVQWFLLNTYSTYRFILVTSSRLVAKLD